MFLLLLLAENIIGGKLNHEESNLLLKIQDGGNKKQSNRSGLYCGFFVK